MIESVMLFAAVVLMARIANAEDESPFAWGGLTFLLCLGSRMFVPLPFARIMGAAILSFVLMTVYKLIRDR